MSEEGCYAIEKEDKEWIERTYLHLEQQMKILVFVRYCGPAGNYVRIFVVQA